MVNNENIATKEVDGAPGIIIVDPNAVEIDGRREPRYIRQEDLMIYVELTSSMNPKSNYLDYGKTSANQVIISKGKYYSSVQAKEDATTNRAFFTTNWTEMFDEKKPYDTEGFGIQSIDIEYNASLVPKIHIEFIDVRAKNLLERGNDPDNPYNFFYVFPYPLFNLTVKGYLGKSIRMPLVMEKTITRFDPQTGSYIISADFRSWTFAMLNDLIAGYALIAPYMFPYEKDGQKRYKGQDKIDELNQKYLDSLPPRKKDLPEYEKGFTRLVNFFILSQGLSNILKSDDMGKSLRRSGSVNNIAHNLDFFQKQSLNWINSNPPTTEQNVVELIQATRTPILNEINNLIKDGYSPEPENWKPIVEKIFDLQNYWDYTDNSADKTAIPMTDELKDLLYIPIVDFNDAERKKDASGIKEKFMNTLGFYPSVENVVRVVITHIDAFMQLLVEHTQKEIFDKIKNEGGMTTSSKFKCEYVELGDGKYYRLPWPEFYRGDNPDAPTSRDYPGFSTNPEVSGIDGWGEVKFIDAMYSAYEAFLRDLDVTEKGSFLGGDIFIVSPISLNLAQTGGNLIKPGMISIDNDETTILNHFLEQMILMVYHNGLLYKSTVQESKSKVIYSEIIDHMVDLIYQEVKTTSNAFQIISALKEKCARIGTVDLLVGHMRKEDAKFLDGVLEVGELDNHLQLAKPHQYIVKSEYLPSSDFKTKYVEINRNQATYVYSPSQLVFNPDAVKVLSLFEFNNTTPVDGSATAPLIYSNNWQSSDMFITRNYM